MPGAYLWGWDATNEVWVKCVVNADGKLIINPTGFLENPPTEDESTKAPTSEWAFDHNANPSAHHAKYTDAESRAAINNILNSSGVLQDIFQCNRQVLNQVENLNMSGQQDGSAVGGQFYEGSSVRYKMWGKKADGTYGNLRFYLYTNGAYYEVVTTRNFPTSLAANLENPPTEDVSNKAPTSEWAFDHDADAAAHHAKYTDAEALAAPSNNTLTLTTGTYVAQSVNGKSIVWLNTSGGNIQLDGLADGYNGQIIRFVRTAATNSVILIDSSVAGGVDEEFYTKTGGDETNAAGGYGGFIAVHLAGKWYVDHDIT